MKVTQHTVEQLAKATQAALQNEQVTRQRVDNIEAGLTRVSVLLGRGFWGRLRWLVMGK